MTLDRYQLNLYELNHGSKISETLTPDLTMSLPIGWNANLQYKTGQGVNRLVIVEKGPSVAVNFEQIRMVAIAHKIQPKVRVRAQLEFENDYLAPWSLSVACSCQMHVQRMLPAVPMHQEDAVSFTTTHHIKGMTTPMVNFVESIMRGNLVRRIAGLDSHTWVDGIKGKPSIFFDGSIRIEECPKPALPAWLDVCKEYNIL